MQNQAAVLSARWLGEAVEWLVAVARGMAVESRRWRHGDMLLGSPCGADGSEAAEAEWVNFGATQCEPPQVDPMMANG